MLRAFGKMTSNLRKMAGDFRTQFDQALREADMDDVRQTLSDAQKLNPANALREAMNPLREMGNEIRNDLQKATAVPPLSEIGKKPENEAGESLLDDLLPTPEMSLPETPPIGGAAPQSASPASAPASATAAASAGTAGTAGTSGAASSPASSPAAASDKPGASSSLVSPAPVAETQTAAPVKKPRAPRATKASSEDAAVPSGSAKRTRTAKAISAAAEPAGAEQVADAKPVRKRAAKASGTATGTNDTDNPANPARTRKKPVTPKDDA